MAPSIVSQRRGNRALIFQGVAYAVALVILLVAPPPHGRMLLVPMPGADAGAAIGFAVGRDARLLARGPLPRSVIVAGDLARLAYPLMRRGVIVLAAPAVGCGETRP